MAENAIRYENVPDIVRTLMTDPALVESQRRFYDALRLPPGEYFDVEIRSRNAGSPSYEFFSTVLTKWITTEGGNATFGRLKDKLIEAGFVNVSGEIKANARSSCTTEGLVNPTNIWFGVPEEIQNFTGRCQELEKLHESVTKSTHHNSTVITAVSGLGGIGKTSLAVKYAWKFHNFFKNVIWINAENSISMKDSFLRLHKELNFKSIEDNGIAETILAVYNYFFGKTALFIFDNVESEDGIAELFLPPLATPNRSRPFLLFTSRNNNWSDKFHVIRLEVFTEVESVDFLTTYLQLKGQRALKLAKRLSETLQRLPIAVRQAAAFIKAQSEKTKKENTQCMHHYIDEFDKNSKSFLSFEYWRKTGDPYRQTTFVTWNMTFKKIKHHKLAIRIIKLIAFWNPENIPIESFNYLIADGILRNLINKMFKNPEYENTIEIRKAIDILSQYSMVTLTSNDELSIHRIVQSVIRDNMSSGEKHKLLLENINVIQNFLTDVTSKESRVSLKYLVQGEALLSHARHELRKTELTGFLKFIIDHRDSAFQMEVDYADDLLRQGKYGEALATYNAIGENITRRLDANNSEVVCTSIAFGVANCEKMIGNCSDALIKYNKIISTVQGSLDLHRKIDGNLSETAVQQMFIFRGECLDSCRRQGEFASSIEQAITKVRSNSVHGEKALEILNLAAFFPQGHVRSSWLSAIYSEEIRSVCFDLLEDYFLGERMEFEECNGFKINLLTRVWIRLSIGEEKKKESLERCLEILYSAPASDIQVSIWTNCLEYPDILSQHSSLGVDTCRYMSASLNHYAKTVSQTVDAFILTVPSTRKQIFQILQDGIVKCNKYENKDFCKYLGYILIGECAAQALQTTYSILSCDQFSYLVISLLEFVIQAQLNRNDGKVHFAEILLKLSENKNISSLLSNSTERWDLIKTKCSFYSDVLTIPLLRHISLQALNRKDEMMEHFKNIDCTYDTDLALLDTCLWLLNISIGFPILVQDVDVIRIVLEVSSRTSQFYKEAGLKQMYFRLLSIRILCEVFLEYSWFEKMAKLSTGAIEFCSECRPELSILVEKMDFRKYKKTIKKCKELFLKDKSIHTTKHFNFRDSSGDTQTVLPVVESNYEVAFERLAIDKNNIIGVGTFATVFKGTLEHGEYLEIVAVKTPNSKSKSVLEGICLKTLLKELNILIYVGQHRNLVGLVGACTGNLYVILDICTNGCLEEYLRAKEESFVNQIANDTLDSTKITEMPEKRQRDRLFTGDLLRWSYQIASGMEYLASKNVIHGDLAARNILLDESFIARISDFGNAHRLYEYERYVLKETIPLAWKWMAPESLRHLEFSIKSDVWSFGITIWEIMKLGETPYPGMLWNVQFIDMVIEGYLLPKPPLANTEIYDIMLNCWKKIPSERASFSELRQRFREIMETQFRPGYADE